jgi:hypothetical protein
VRRPQAGGGFGLAAETRDGELRGRRIAPTNHLRTNQLDRRRPREHAVGRVVDLPHPATTKELAELIASHLASFRDLLPQPGDDV